MGRDRLPRWCVVKEMVFEAGDGDDVDLHAACLQREQVPSG